MADKTAPVGPLRAPLPAVYPVGLIDVACRALEMVNRVSMIPIEMEKFMVETKMCALRILHDGLLSHELAAKEGRSRG